MKHDNLFFWLLIGPIALLLSIAAVFLVASIPALFLAIVLDVSYGISLMVCSIALVVFALLLALTHKPENIAPDTSNQRPSYISGLLTGYWLHHLMARK